MFMFVDISVHCTDCRNINLVKLRCLFEMSEIDKMMKTGEWKKSKFFLLFGSVDLWGRPKNA